jgi:subtilisin
MSIEPKYERYIILPPRGFRPIDVESRASLLWIDQAAANPSETTDFPLPAEGFRVIDSVAPDGPKLVEMTSEGRLLFRKNFPGPRILPLTYYRPALAPRPRVQSLIDTAASHGSSAIVVRVVSQADGEPIAGATVVAFTDFTGRLGAKGVTDSSGFVTLALGSSRVELDRLYTYPRRGFWSDVRREFALTSGATIALEPLDLNYIDAVRFFFPNATLSDGANVVVGLIDTGVDLNHPDLEVQGGLNTVPGEDPETYGDNGVGHGTHVAGIIAARGTPPRGLRGIAPGVVLKSYRVFPQGSDAASNYAISKAIDRAVQDGCDLINLSLGGPVNDPALLSAVNDARAEGTLPIVSAGDDFRGPVKYPAADGASVAISAMGRIGTFPASAVEAVEVAPPFGVDPADFLADFTNVGPQIAIVGPGVAILSTFTGGYAVLSGTSQACAAITAATAKILAENTAIMAMPRDQNRSNAIARILYQSAKPFGFGAEEEGHGAPRF